MSRQANQGLNDNQFVVPATQEIKKKSGGLLEPRLSSPGWAVWCLKNKSRYSGICNLILILLSGQKLKDDELEISLGFRLFVSVKKGQEWGKRQDNE